MQGADTTSSGLAHRRVGRTIGAFATRSARASNTEPKRCGLTEARALRVIGARFCAQLPNTVGRRAVTTAGISAGLCDALIAPTDQPLLTYAANRDSLRHAVRLIVAATIRVGL